MCTNYVLKTTLTGRLFLIVKNFWVTTQYKVVKFTIANSLSMKAFMKLSLVVVLVCAALVTTAKEKGEKAATTNATQVSGLAFITLHTNAETAMLRWGAFADQGRGGFIIERSAADGNWEAIEIVSETSSTKRVHTYHWLDQSPQEGMNQYRVKHIGAHGKISYSATRTYLHESES